MLASPFAFYRGAAYLMAADLASTPRSELTVQACGNASDAGSRVVSGATDPLPLSLDAGTNRHGT